MTQVSYVSLCNTALTKIGAKHIRAPNENSPAARECAAHFEITRDETLVMHPWNFAVKRDSWPALADKPAWGYEYAYALPADYLKVWSMELEDYDFKVESGQLLTDVGPPLNVRYIRRVTDMTEFTFEFISAFTTILAAKISYKLANNAALTTEVRTAAENLIRQAKSSDAQEGTPDQPMETSWIDARLRWS